MNIERRVAEVNGSLSHPQFGLNAAGSPPCGLNLHSPVTASAMLLTFLHNTLLGTPQLTCSPVDCI